MDVTDNNSRTRPPPPPPPPVSAPATGVDKVRDPRLVQGAPAVPPRPAARDAFVAEAGTAAAAAAPREDPTRAARARLEHAGQQVRRGLASSPPSPLAPAPAPPATTTTAPTASPAAAPRASVSAEDQRAIDTLATSDSGPARAQAWQTLERALHPGMPNTRASAADKRQAAAVAEAMGKALGEHPEQLADKRSGLNLKNTLASHARRGDDAARRALEDAGDRARVGSLSRGSDAEQARAQHDVVAHLQSGAPADRKRLAAALGASARGDDYAHYRALATLDQAGTPEALDQVAKTGDFASSQILARHGEAGLDAAMRQWGSMTPEQRANMEGLLGSDAAKARLAAGDPAVTAAAGDIIMQDPIGDSLMRSELAAAGTPAAAAQLARATGHENEPTRSLAAADLDRMGKTGVDAAAAAWGAASDAHTGALLRVLGSAEGLKTPAGQQALLDAARARDPALRAQGVEALDVAGRCGRGDDAFRRQAVAAAADAAANAETTDDAAKAMRAADANLPRLSTWGPQGQDSRAANVDAFASMAHAAESATPAGRAALEARARAVAKALGASDDAVDKARAVRRGSPDERASALARSNAEDLALEDARLGKDGLGLNDALDNVRAQASTTSAYDRALSNVAQHNQAVASEALRRAEKAGDESAVTRFAKQNVFDQTGERASWNERRALDTLAGARSGLATHEMMRAVAGRGRDSLDAARSSLKRLGDAASVERAGSRALANRDPAVREAAASLMTTNGTDAAKASAAQARRAELARRTDAAQKVMADTDARFKESMERLPELQAVREGLKQEGVEVPRALDTAIGVLQRSKADVVGQREAAAKKVADYLRDPEVRRSLGNLSQEEAGEALEAATGAIASTQAGKAFAQDVAAKELGGSSVDDPLFKKVFDGASKSATLASRSLKVVDNMVAGLSAAGPGSYRHAVAHAVGATSDQVREWAAMTKEARLNPSSSMVKSLGKVAHGVNHLSNSLDVMSAGLSLQNAVNNPTDARAWTDAAKDIALAARDFTTTGSKAFTAWTAVAAPLTAITGELDTLSALDRGDWDAAAGNGAVALGGGLATAGVIMSATGVGAAAGVPLMVVGGIVSAGGSLYAHFFKDGPAEARAKELGFLS